MSIIFLKTRIDLEEVGQLQNEKSSPDTNIYHTTQRDRSQPSKLNEIAMFHLDLVRGLDEEQTHIRVGARGEGHSEVIQSTSYHTN